MNLKTTLLNGNRTEGFVNPKNVGKICKLQKSICGLKEESWSWNMHFNEVVNELDFIKNVEEHCVYNKVSGSVDIFLVLYVDDILLIRNDIPMLEVVKSLLREFLDERFRRSDVHFEHNDL
jgi:hypothetical protein